MNVDRTSIQGVHLWRPEVHQDRRGEFWRSYCHEALEAAGIDFSVQQSNLSVNLVSHTLRGFHFQRPPSREQKILTVVTGSVYAVIVDLRPDSATYLTWESFEITVGDRTSLIVASGCATGYLTLASETIVHYQMSDVFRPDCYGGFRFDDPLIGVEWPASPEVISQRDLEFGPLNSEEFAGVAMPT
jgi:dTDP-4-dehydrorhamnose 3,5-epimerase